MYHQVYEHNRHIVIFTIGFMNIIDIIVILIFTIRFMNIIDIIVILTIRFMNIIDNVVIVSYAVDIVFESMFPLDSLYYRNSKAIAATAVIRIAGFMRLFNIARYSQLLYCLGIYVARFKKSGEI